MYCIVHGHNTVLRKTSKNLPNRSDPDKNYLPTPRNFIVDMNTHFLVNNCVPDRKKAATDAGLKRLLNKRSTIKRSPNMADPFQTLEIQRPRVARYFYWSSTLMLGVVGDRKSVVRERV